MSETNYGSLYHTLKEEPEEEIEEPEYEKEEKKGFSTGLITFLVLFLLSTGLLVYYQFYQGYGHWDFTFVHKANDASFISMISKNVNKNDAQSASLKLENDSLKKTLANAAKSPEDKMGTIYQVQIGAYNNKAMQQFAESMTGLKMEQDKGLLKFTLGVFTTFPEADAFKNEVRRMGIHRAWVVKKVDGVRTEFDPKTEK
jgi:hypothetical protein